MGTRLAVRTVTGEAGEEPESFVLLGKPFPVREILDRWFGEDHAYFKVLAEDQVVYILRYSLTEAEWDLVVMDATQRPGAVTGRG